jgi:hypothetical protein
VSQDAVRTVVEAKCFTLPNIARVYPEGAPDGGILPNEIPAMVIDLIQSRPEAITLTPTISHQYEIRLTAYLGQPGANSQQVKANLREWALDDNLIAAFMDDWTLDGTCFNCDITEGADNLDTYRDEVKAPKRQWRLFVTEHI